MGSVQIAICRADPKPTLPEQLPKPPVRAHNPLNQSFKVNTAQCTIAAMKDVQTPLSRSASQTHKVILSNES